MNQGKNLIVIGTIPPKIVANDVVRIIEAEELNRSYWSVSDMKIFPKTSKLKVIYNASDYIELKPDPTAGVLLIPPAMSSPPELAGNGMKVSDKPGLVIRKYGKGTIAYIPWNAGAMYTSQASTSIYLLVSELIDHLLDGKRQVITDAHSLVEISLMKNADKNATLLHLINNTGQLQGSNDGVIPLYQMNFSIRGEFKKVYWPDGQIIPSKIEKGYTRFVVDKLDVYRFVVLQ